MSIDFHLIFSSRPTHRNSTEAANYLRAQELCQELIFRAWKSGRDAASIYHSLKENGDGVFHRSGGGERVVETGQYWRQVSHMALRHLNCEQGAES